MYVSVAYIKPSVPDILSVLLRFVNRGERIPNLSFKALTSFLLGLLNKNVYRIDLHSFHIISSSSFWVFT